MSIRQRITLLRFLGLLPLLIISGIGLLALRNADPRKSDVAVIGAALREQMEADMMHDALRGDVQAALLAEDAQQLEAAEADLKDHRRTIRASFSKILEMNLPAAITNEVKAIQPRVDGYTLAAEQTIHAIAADRVTGKSLLPEFTRQFRALEKEMNTLDNLMDEAMKSTHQSAVDQVSAGRITLLATCACAFLVLLGAAIWISRSVANALFRGIRALSQSAERVSGASSEIAQSSHSVAKAATEQANSLQEASVASEEVQSMARRNSEKTRSATDLVVRSQSRFQEANQSLDHVLTAMAEIDQQSAKISNIIKVIDGIAFQTNILALNAAVEAARAGAAGTSFAVVADEVRNLAQRCAQAARDTAALIGDSIAKAGDGRAKMNNMAEVIRQMTEEAAKLGSLVSEVGAGSEEQTRGIDRISTVITRMDQATQATAANAEQSAASAQELHRQSKALQDVVFGLTEIVGSSGR